MPVRPITTTGLVTELAETIAACRPGERPRIALDGAPPTRPDELAESVAAALRTLGRPTLVLRANDFLRPASLRFEPGRTDPDAYYTGWLNVGGLRREVFDQADRVLPSLWDATTDRASRAGYVDLPPGAVVLVAGTLLLGQGLPFDLTVHLALSPGALTRQLDDELRWTLPAHQRYADEVGPDRLADVVVRYDHPTHPAIQHNNHARS